MGRDDDRDAPLVDQLTQDAHHRPPPPGVELRGRLVGNQEAGLVGQRAGDGDPLLLAA